MSTDDTAAPTTADGTSMAFVANKKKDSWRTPPALYEPIAEAVDGIDLDPCAGPSGDRLELPDDAEPAEDLPPTAIAEQNVMPWEDGLSVPWQGDVFVNPPFSDVDEWLAMAVGAWMGGDADRVFFVTAANTGTLGWYHRWIASFASLTYFTGPRQNYIDPETGELASGVSFNTAVSVFGTVPEALAQYWRREGDLVVRPWNAGGIAAGQGEGGDRC